MSSAPGLPVSRGFDREYLAPLVRPKGADSVLHSVTVDPPTGAPTAQYDVASIAPGSVFK